MYILGISFSYTISQSILKIHSNDLRLLTSGIFNESCKKMHVVFVCWQPVCLLFVFKLHELNCDDTLTGFLL